MAEIEFTDYESLLEDKPYKFSAESVGYSAGTGAERCIRCIHFYEGRAAKRAVCEIMRPEDDANVKPEWKCTFFTTDGKAYPLYAEHEEEEAKEDES
jgi:hypothetical protein